MPALTHPLPDLDAWLHFFSDEEIPVLRQTLRRLDELHAKADDIAGKDLATVVLQDPLIAVRVISFIHKAFSKRLQSEITNIGNAIMMLGIEPFFRNLGTPVTIETVLKDERHGLLGVLQIIRRVQRAAGYAREWAIERHDLCVEEVELAALLHDLSEVLLWCFAPKLAIEIRDLKRKDKSQSLEAIEEQVLGIRLRDLQLALCEAWHLPQLLKTLMDKDNAHDPRVRNVTLAVRLARNSADTWDNPELIEDFESIEYLLHMDRAVLLNRLGVPANLIDLYLTTPEDFTRTVIL